MASFFVYIEIFAYIKRKNFKFSTKIIPIDKKWTKLAPGVTENLFDKSTKKFLTLLVHNIPSKMNLNIKRLPNY